MAGENIKAKNMVSDMMNELFYKFQNIFIKRQTESFNQTLHYHNFAAQFGGATVIDKNQGCQNAKSVLSDDKDKYLMNECSRNNKFITIMLKEDVTVEGFSIINKEFYSSNVKDMEIYGSQTYPTQEWVLLGKVKAQDNSNWQDFELKNVWIRFIKFVFLTHYREEYFCTITQLKVFGNTMLQDLKSQVNLNLQENSKQQIFIFGNILYFYYKIDSESEDEEDIEHSDKEENFSNIEEEENSVNQQIKLIKQQLGKREKTEYSDKFNQLYSTYNDNNCPAISKNLIILQQYIMLLNKSTNSRK
ncbi:Galactose-binding domain protein [Pseudocohnilembus persalinus]|uniref:Galactose-binding domain protein n=1 Tax=Pseudocohnilembus persalinus TaxID=266149 RepID=A0A0V0QP00_PSEPJ|nr:Galactose-binding domain protein [Pseudocohnilembus persalinus]|eukprot:KRX04006.1 Galactose-binding domain protein [Pseudocohnilembus persalinus]